jgi:carbamoyl-phosphate synthase small subunit
MISNSDSANNSGNASTAIAKLALEDGTVYSGLSLGATGTTTGEVVFNTSMTGYQEILSDPSYCGQIITMTYPEIGNYGVNEEDLESSKVHASGFVVRNPSRIASNFRSNGTIGEFLAKQGIVGIYDIDTRSLVRHIRNQGAMRGVISTEILDENELVQLAKDSPSMAGRDLVKEVLPEQPVNWEQRLSPWWHTSEQNEIERDPNQPHIVALDYGMKWNIARHLYEQGFKVTIVPGSVSADEILALKPDGVFLSNGPGDPEPLDYAVETIRNLLGQVPIFGICLGHQLLSLALGAKTFKLKFGHRGANQPVINLETGKIEITSQNHGFAVSDEELPKGVVVTHRNLNDDTVAGIRHESLPAFSVQYHPEASAGPHDSQYLFGKFTRLIQGGSINDEPVVLK